MMSTMQSLNDDERREVLGEFLSDELKAILEYVKNMPTMQRELHQVNATVNDISDRLNIIEHVVKGHESDVNQLKHKAA